MSQPVLTRIAYLPVNPQMGVAVLAHAARGVARELQEGTFRLRRRPTVRRHDVVQRRLVGIYDPLVQVQHTGN
jgi:hypothetical protein